MTKELKGLLDETFGKLDRDPFSLNIARTLSVPGPVLNNHFMSSDLVSSDPMLVEMYSKVAVSNERPHVHLALMYSNPLVDFSSDGSHGIKNAHNMSDPVNFSVECNKIWDTIKKSNKNINIHIECATNK